MQRPSVTDHASTTYERAFDGREDVYAAWLALNATIRDHAGLPTYRVATVAAALRIGSPCCSLAHGLALAAERDVDIVAVVHEPAASGLMAADLVVMEVARRIVDGDTRPPGEEQESLRVHGFDEDAFRDIVLTVAARRFFTTILGALGVEPDPSHDTAAPEVRAALTGVARS